MVAKEVWAAVESAVEIISHIMYFFVRSGIPALINTYSMKQPDLYYFETIKMTSQA